MAKFPTEVERSIVVRVPADRAYAYLWDVAGSATCVPGIDRCQPVGPDTFCFIFQERSAGPASLAPRYTAHYEGDGTREIRFRSTAAADDNTDVDGTITLEPEGPSSTRITLRQMIAPDTPVPRLVQGLIRSFVEKESATAVVDYLAAVKRALEA